MFSNETACIFMDSFFSAFLKIYDSKHFFVKTRELMIISWNWMDNEKMGFKYYY